MAFRQSRILLALLSGAALVAAASAPSRAADELRIGLIAPMTGPFAQVGKDMVDGFNMYLEENKGEFAGAKVKLIVEDDQAKPDTGVTKAKKLILQDKVHMLVGGVLASTGYALAPVSTADKTVYLPSVPASDDLTQRDLAKFPYLIRTGWTSSQPHHALGAWACEQGSQEDRRDRAPTMRSATRSSAASRRRSKTAAGRSSRRSGRRSAPRTSGRSFRASRPTSTRFCR